MPLILLVEDNEMNRDMLARRLKKKGYEMAFAEDGVQAIEQTRALKPDLVLMDLSLPEMDGWEATRQIKADAALAQIPVIALTAHAMAGDKEKALQAGCDGYATKPIQFKELHTQILQYLE